MARNARHLKILEIISDRPVETQEELANALVSSGFNVTQATVSRDIKELGLIKINDGGRQRYVREGGKEKHYLSNIANIYRNAVLSITSAQNLVIIKTVPGGASTVGMNIDRLEELANYIKSSSLCGLGQTAPNPILSTLRYFRDEYIAHVVDKKCPAGVCKSLLRYKIDPAKCKGCTLCARKCPVGAISGSVREAHTIDAAKCIKCGVCMSTCKFGAISRA